MADRQYAYVARCRTCDGTTGILVDEPSHAEAGAETLAEWYRRGDYLQRVSVEKSRCAGICKCQPSNEGEGK